MGQKKPLSVSKETPKLMHACACKPPSQCMHHTQLACMHHTQHACACTCPTPFFGGGEGVLFRVRGWVATTTHVHVHACMHDVVGGWVGHVCMHACACMCACMHTCACAYACMRMQHMHATHACMHVHACNMCMHA